MSDIGLTGGVADAAAGGDAGLDTQQSAFSFMQDANQQGNTQEPAQQTQGNPAWQPFLEKIPTPLHAQITPLLQQWDKGVQDRFTQVQQQYAPWKPLIDQGLDPDTVVGLVQMLETDPRRIYDELANFHGYNADQGQGNNQDPNAFNLDQIEDPNGPLDLNQNPEFQQLKLQNEQLLQWANSQVQNTVQQQAQQELEQEIETVKQQNPGIIEPVLLSLAHTYGLSVTDAVSKYNEVMAASGVTARPAPSVLSPTGGVPLTNQVQPSELSSKDKRSMVAQILQAAASQND